MDWQIMYAEKLGFSIGLIIGGMFLGFALFVMAYIFLVKGHESREVKFDNILVVLFVVLIVVVLAAQVVNWL